MATTGVAYSPPVIHYHHISSLNYIRRRAGFNPRRSRRGLISVSASLHSDQSIENKSFTNTRLEADAGVHRRYREDKDKEVEEEDSAVEPDQRLNFKDYFEITKHVKQLQSEGGPPRWFSPLECGSPLTNSPLLLYLPGIDGVGLGLIFQHQTLGKIFDVWCLHTPATDRTPFTELVKLVERTVRSEAHRSPQRPIYLVGESFGGCLALSVASNNPDIDLVLVLVNPATCFRKSQLPLLISLLEIMPGQLRLGLPSMMTLLAGTTSKMLMRTLENGVPLQQIIIELSKGLVELPSNLSGLVDDFTVETLLWKLKMVESASACANSRLHAVKAQTLILSSGRDQLLPSLDEGERLRRTLSKCEVRRFSESGHFLLLDSDLDLATILRGSSYYRRSRYFDYVKDYLPPSPTEVSKVRESYRWLEETYSPVMLSTLENGKIVRGLAGIPSEGPVLIVGYHMLLGLELAPLVLHMFSERNIVLRGVAHPLLFSKLKEGFLPDISTFDQHRIMGAVPVSPSNLFKLFSTKSHVLLYPGGMREALHHKGEEYKLFWPERSEFVRMAARFGAKIVPFGVVGEDDIGQLILDYNDQMKIPYLKNFIEELTEEGVRLRSDSGGEVSNQNIHFPVILPKLPGRLYYLFGKPIETEGRKEELRDREKAQELYLEVKSEVEKCLSYLKEKRENDPYRNILARSVYQAMNGFESQVPTFEL